MRVKFVEYVWRFVKASIIRRFIILGRSGNLIMDQIDWKI